MPDGPTTTVVSDSSVPWPVLLGTAIRALLTMLGGFGIAWAQGVTGDQITMIVSFLMVIGGIAWSFIQKWMTARREHQIAVMSAKGGKAVQPESTAP